MEMTDSEALMIITTVLLLPGMIVLSYAFFNGSLTNSEDNKYLPLREAEEDYWSGSGGDTRQSLRLVENHVQPPESEGGDER